MNTAPECVDMTESLRRGAGRLLYNGDEGSLVLSMDGTFLLSDMLDGALLCEKIRTLCPAAPNLRAMPSQASPVFMTTAAWACSKFYRRSAAAGMPRSWKHF